MKHRAQKLFMLGMSLAVAGLMLVTAIGLVSAAGGSWQNSLAVDGGPVRHLVAAGQVSPTLLYAVTEDAGVWKSSDGAATWQATTVVVTDNTNLYINALAVSPDGLTLYGARNWAWGPNAQMWKSTDGGDSWAKNSMIMNTAVEAMAMFNQAGLVIAGSDWGDDRPLFYGTGNGTWNEAKVTGTYTDYVAIVTLAESSDMMYAGGDVDDGFDWIPVIYTSTDGMNWQEVYIDNTIEDYVSQIAVDPRGPTYTAYALLDNARTIQVSNDHGQSWTEIDPNEVPFENNATALGVDSQGRLYVADHEKIYRSDNQGQTFAFIGQTFDRTAIRQPIVVDPNDDSVVYFGADEKAGVYKTPDAYQVGAAAYTIQAANTGLKGYQISRVAGLTDTMYATTRGVGVHKSSDGGQTWRNVSEGLLDYAGVVVVHPTDPDIAYVADYDRLYYTGDGGEIWERRDNGLPDDEDIEDLLVHPAAPATVYAATRQGVYRSTNSGLNWTATDLVTHTRGLDVYPSTPYTLYAALEAYNGPPPPPSLNDFYYSTNGQNWMPLHNSGCPYGPKDILVNPITPTQLFASSCGNFLWYDGMAWNETNNFSATQPLPEGGYPARLAVDSQARKIYAALGVNGLYMAGLSDLSSWSMVTDGLSGTTYVGAVFYNEQNDILFAGTGGAGLYQLGGAGGIYLPLIVK